MILITLFLGTAIALNSDEEPKVYPGAMYFPPSRPIYERPIYERPIYERPIYGRPIYERPTRTHGNWSADIDENKYISETENINQTLWRPDNDENKYIFSKDIFEQMLSSMRLKRNSPGGALRIQMNNALPILADVEPVRVSDPAKMAATVTEKVTAPADTIYEVKSLRKSLLPLPHKFEIARSINRIITITLLVTYVIVEFCPVLDYLFQLFGI